MKSAKTAAAIPVIALLAWLFPMAEAVAALRTETVEYRQGDKVLEGYLAYDDVVTGRRPGVLVVHEWWGVNDYVKGRVDQLARLGYVAFAADMYGKGVLAKDADEAGKLAGALRADRKLMRERAVAGLKVLQGHGLVDPSRLAAIGYCFGGTVVLELARAGADVAGVVSIHGVLDAASQGEVPGIRAHVLALAGADDPFVPPAQLQAFMEEMRKSGADWEVVVYGGAVHGFTNPANGRDKPKGLAYDEKADRRSWEAMKAFLAELFS
jgi:dienelactone hydrolase